MFETEILAVYENAIDFFFNRAEGVSLEFMFTFV